MDNFEAIKPFLTFSEEGDFYPIQIIKRKKDQEDKKSRSSQLIQSYAITGLEQLDSIREEITRICDENTARAYISINKRNHSDMGLTLISRITTRGINKTLPMDETIRRILEISERLSKGIQDHSELPYFSGYIDNAPLKEKRWIIDIDPKSSPIEEKHLTYIEEIISDISGSKETFIGRIQTKSGWHIITKPFFTLMFESALDKTLPIEIEIKKGPAKTLLYFPS